jgi:uncharacterized surface protein with fasciclin (FAS1) repeats
MMRSVAAAAAATLAVAAVSATLAVSAALAEETVMVGGQEMFPTKTIVANAINSADHTTLVAAVKAADLAGTLSGKGPFTVFAPVNAAFSALPAGTVDMLLKPENKAKLAAVLTYHVVPGTYTEAKLMQLIKAGHGEAKLKTVEGGELTFTMNGSRNVVVKDEKGGTADITTYDVLQSNGVIQVIDKVLLPG